MKIGEDANIVSGAIHQSVTDTKCSVNVMELMKIRIKPVNATITMTGSRK